jgi:hypothetical protein
MKEKDELFILIQSMDKNEKGYFKKFAGISGQKDNSIYTRLFDAIGSMKTYDPLVIKAIFKGEKVLKHLTVTKFYLKNLILKSLRNYYNDTDPEIEQENAMAEIKVLMNKQLNESALRMISKLKKANLLRGDDLKLLQLSLMEYRVLMRKASYREITSTAQNRLAEEKGYLKNYEILSAYRNLQGTIMGIMGTKGHEANDPEMINQLLKNPLLQNEDKALSFKARAMRYEALSRLYKLLHDDAKSLQVAIDTVELYRAHPVKKKLSAFNYLTALKNLFSRYDANYRYTDCINCLKEMEEVLSDPGAKMNEAHRQMMTFSVCESKLALFPNMGEFAKGIEAEKDFRLLTKDKPMTKQQAVTTGFFSAFCYLGAGQPAEALERVNEVLNGPYAGARDDIMLVIHSINILVHYELGNYLLIKRLLKVMHHFMMANHFPDEGWKEFQKKINEIVRARTSGNAREVKDCFRALQKVYKSYNFLDVELMTWWIGNKLAG